MPNIIQKPIGRECSFMNQLYTPLWFVVHFTGGTPNLQSLYNYWISQCGVGSNSHFGIERYDNAYAKAGDIWQFLDYTRDGACANCCLESGYAPFLPGGVNMNVRTISVECINPDTGNNGDMPQAQFDSLVYLIKKVCSDMGIPTTNTYTYWNGYENSHTYGNASGGIIMHRDIAPQNRRMCPGTPYYSGQMDRVIEAVNSGSTPPSTEIGEDENMYQPLELNKPFTTTLPETGFIWLSSANGISVISTSYYHWESKSWTHGSYTVDNNKGPLSIADISKSDITQVLVEVTSVTPTNNPHPVASTISIIR